MEPLLIRSRADPPLLTFKSTLFFRGFGERIVLIVAVTLATKAIVLQNLLWPSEHKDFLAQIRVLHGLSVDLYPTSSPISLEAKDLEEETKRAWAYNRNGFVRYGRSIGAGGMPLAAAAVLKNGSDSDQLISQQFEKVPIARFTGMTCGLIPWRRLLVNLSIRMQLDQTSL